MNRRHLGDRSFLQEFGPNESRASGPILSHDQQKERERALDARTDLDLAQKTLVREGDYHPSLALDLRAWRAFDRNARQTGNQALIFRRGGAVVLRSHGPIQNSTSHSWSGLYTRSPWFASVDTHRTDKVTAHRGDDPEDVPLFGGEEAHFFYFAVGRVGILRALATEDRINGHEDLYYTALRYIGVPSIDLDKTLGEQADKLRDAAMTRVGSLAVSLANAKQWPEDARTTNPLWIAQAAMQAHAYNLGRDEILDHAAEAAENSRVSGNNWLERRVVVRLATPFVDTILDLKDEIRDHLVKDAC